MSKQLICIVLLACSPIVDAADWQREFNSSITNELPPSRGVAVDDLGYVHLQAFNKYSGSSDYYLVHQYTIGAQGGIPWIWGLSQTDRMSDCGVYAKSGQRLDCIKTAGWNAPQTRLEMRSRYSADVIWQTVLPGEVELLDASIPTQDEVLFVGRIDGQSGHELGVFRARSYAPAEALSIVPACPQMGQTIVESRFRMPAQPGESIRHLKACLSDSGVTDLILEAFDTQASQWATLSTWMLPGDQQLRHADINAEGKAFALIEHRDGFRELIRTPIHADQWEPAPFPAKGEVIGFLVGSQGLVVVTLPDAWEASSLELGTMIETVLRSSGTPTVSWFDLNGSPWPTMHMFGKLGDIAPEGFALSSNGALIFVGSEASLPDTEQLWLTDRHGQSHIIAALPLTADETSVGTPYVIGGPNNVAVIARTIVKTDNFGDTWTAVRVNQYDLPMSP